MMNKPRFDRHALCFAKVANDLVRNTNAASSHFVSDLSGEFTVQHCLEIT